MNGIHDFATARLAVILEENEINQGGLAKLMGWSQSKLSEKINGKRPLKYAEFLLICDVLKLPDHKVVYLITGKNEFEQDGAKELMAAMNEVSPEFVLDRLEENHNEPAKMAVQLLHNIANAI